MTLPKRLVIASGARNIWEDLRGVEGEYDLMAVNDLIMHIPHPLKYGYSNDSRRLQYWSSLRRRGYEGPQSLHSLESRTSGEFGAEKTIPVIGHKLSGLGTSPLSACYVGLEMGYEQILLAGVPLDDSGHYFDPPDIHTNRLHQDFYHQEGQMKYWKAANFNTGPKHKHKVKSLSGNTRKLLGGPEDWIR